MGLRFLHLADLDLGARHPLLGDLAEDREREVMESFREAVTYAIDPENRIDAVLVAGNLFDRHRPRPEVWGFVRGLFGQLAAARKPVVMIPGCRDGYGYKDSVYRTEKLPGTTILVEPEPGEPVRTEISGTPVWFYGIANQPGLTSSPFKGFARRDGEGLHVGLLNGAIPDHAEWDVRPRDLVIEPEILSESGLDYVALGGFHQQTVLQLEGTTAAYAGCLEGRDFRPGDLGEKSLLVAEVGPEGVTFETRPINRRRLEDWQIDLAAEGISDTEALVCGLLGRADPKVIARVTLVGGPEFLCDLDEVAGRVAGRFHHLVMVDDTDLLGSGLLRRIKGEHTIRGFYVRRMLDRVSDLQKRAEGSGQDAPAHRELRVARLALKLGLEQFLEEEPTGDLLYQPPSRPTRTQDEARPPSRDRDEDAGRAGVLLRSDGKPEAAADGEATA